MISTMISPHWKSILGMILGITWGWLTHPIVWLPFSLLGPFRAIALLLACAKQESGYNPLAEGDIGNKYGSSVGMLQFNASRWPSLTGAKRENGEWVGGRSLEDRKSCFWSGYYAIVYIQDALLSDLGWWWQLRTPVVAIASLRWMWTHGNEDAPELAEAWPKMKAEGQTWGAYLLWSAVFVPVSLAIMAGLYFLKLKKRRA